MDINIKSPSYYSDKLKELNTTFYLVLDELVKMYPIYKANPDYPEYQNMYAIDTGNFEKAKKDLFLLKNSIERDSEIVNINVKKMNAMIDILEKRNSNLRNKYHISSSSVLSSEGLISQKQEVYNEKLLNLFFLILGVTGVAVMNYREK
jgi:hypothetical protein